MNAPRRNHGFTDEQLHRMCRRKMRYADEMGATAGAMCSLDRRPEVRRLWVYPCPACKGWHLTKYRVAGRRPVTGEKGEQMLDVSVSTIAAFSRDGRVFRAFGHLLAAAAGSVLCVPLALAGGSLRHVTDGCPVPWGEAFAVLDEPSRAPVALPELTLAREFPLLAGIAPAAWASDWIGLGPGAPRPVLRLTHESGIRYAVARG